MLRRIIKFGTPLALFALVFFVFHTASAQTQEASDAATQLASQTGLATTDIRIFIANIIKGFLVLLGFVAVVIILYAGYLWMTAGGDADQTKKAQQIMANAAIGLFIIASAYGITAFIFNALTGGQSGFGIGGGGNFQGIFQGTAGTDALGNGIIEYHFPEPGQKNVPRNTRISITFKQPLVLSTVFRGYDDKGTYDTADDVLPPVLELNTDNFRILDEDQLGTAGTGSVDEQFANRYPANVILDNPAPIAAVTQVPAVANFNPSARQTLVIIPQALLGSPTQDVNYRVGLRGGPNGIKVWDVKTGTTQPFSKAAFGRATAEGGYRWSFTTDTKLDQVPPVVSAVVPDTNEVPEKTPVPRNQLLQVYFSEAVDPTRVTGEVTATGGNVSVQIEAKCSADAPQGQCDARYQNAFAFIPGNYVIGNKLRTIEFTPSTECENVAENSCGEKVFCLPKNVDLRVRMIAADVGSQAPASIGTSGVIDMVGNSLDGNKDGDAVGPVSSTRTEFYVINNPQIELKTVSDSAEAQFAINDTIDLTSPVVIDIDPKSAIEGGEPSLSTPYSEGGPSSFPTTRPIAVTWSKILSISSLKTGAPDDQKATVVLDSNECVKQGTNTCSASEPCTCRAVEPPSFFLDGGEPLDLPGGGQGTALKLFHRTFFTANDLGFSEEDLSAFPQGAPRYVPQFRAKIKDTRQNCFYPSVGFACDADRMNAEELKSCCDRIPQKTFSCPN